MRARVQRHGRNGCMGEGKIKKGIGKMWKKLSENGGRSAGEQESSILKKRSAIGVGRRSSESKNTSIGSGAKTAERNLFVV